MVGNIINQIKESGLKIKSRIAVIQQLLQQDIINLEEFDHLMKFEDTQYESEAKCSRSSECWSKKETVSKHSELSIQTDDIKVKTH